MILFVIVAVIVGLVLLLMKSGSSSAPSRHHSAFVTDPTPEAFIQRAAAATAGLPQHTLSGVGGSTLIVTRNYTAAWRIMVAVLFFPIGLIALLERDNETATIAAMSDAGRTRVTLDGTFNGQLIDRINSILN